MAEAAAQQHRQPQPAAKKPRAVIHDEATGKPVFYGPRESSAWYHGSWPIFRLFVHLAGTAGFEIGDEDAARLRALYKHAALLCPNHPTPAEGPMMYLISHRLNLRYNHCAALEIYDKFGPLGPRILPGNGCFSIRRRLIDFPAIRTARALLTERRNIVLFPEGEISGLSDRLLPLERGGVQMAFWGLEEMRERGLPEAEPLYIVPLAIKYRETGNAEQEIRNSLSRLEKALSLPPAPSERGGLWRLQRIESAYLATLEADLDLPPLTESLNGRWNRVRAALESRAAEGLGIAAPRSDLLTNPQRARELLNAWDAAWFSFGPKGPPKETRKWAHLKAIHKDIARLNRFMGFEETYVTEWPSVDRFGDVLRRIEDQVLGKSGFRHRRMARLRVGDPINIAPLFAEYRRDRKATVSRVMDELEARLNHLLETVIREVSQPWPGAQDAASPSSLPASGSAAVTSSATVADRRRAV
jgi:1-acyl-sn-glycerol-3-phosphate acyltransferase